MSSAAARPSVLRAVLALAATAALAASAQPAHATAGTCGTTGVQTQQESAAGCRYTTLGEDTYVVPAGVTHLLVTALGQVGRSSSSQSGRGASVSAQVPVQPGQTLFVEVGVGGGHGVPGGPGAYGYGSHSYSGGDGAPGTAGGDGGGGSALQSCSTTTFNCAQSARDGYEIVVAGGGGGGAGNGGDGGWGEGGKAEAHGGMGGAGGAGGVGGGYRVPDDLGFDGARGGIGGQPASAGTIGAGGSEGGYGSVYGAHGDSTYYGGEGGYPATGGDGGASFVQPDASDISMGPADWNPPSVSITEVQETQTTVQCGPSRPAGTAQTCTATVSNTAEPSNAPVGSVTFESSGDGSFSDQVCAYPAPGGACSVRFTPSGSAAQTVSAHYLGRRGLAPSTGMASLDVTPAGSTTTFACSSVEQTYRVPIGSSSVTVEAIGAAGGGYTGNGQTRTGGKGAKVSGVLTGLTGGQILYVDAGCDGVTVGPSDDSSATGGSGGGGDGGASSTSGSGGGGGGASDVRTVPTADAGSLASRLIVAAGGGGAGGLSGGNGGDAGASGDPSAGADNGGGAGGTAAGGAGGNHTPGSGQTGYNGLPGVLGSGGAGGFNDGGGGGGGGGGYYGGGGGGGGGDGTSGSGRSSGGGGGGSSLVPAGGSASPTTMSPSVTITAIVPDPQPESQPMAPTQQQSSDQPTAAAGSASQASPSASANPGAPAATLRSATLKLTTFTAKAGTTLNVTLARASKLTVTLKRQLAGHKVGKRCVAGRKAGAKRCTAVVTKTLTFTGKAGLNALAFGKRLPRGKYTATVAAAGSGAPVRLRFTVR